MAKRKKKRPVLNVFGVEIPIEENKEFLEPLGYEGLYDPQGKRIIVRDLKCVPTLLHEMVHAMFHRSGLLQTSISSDLEEIIAENIATVLHENFDIKWKITKK